jgi:hypothetical protein
MAEKSKKLRVVKDENSPTGYYIVSGNGSGVPATIFEVRLWFMYLEAMDLARRLREELDKWSEHSAEVKGKSEKKSDE